MLNHLLLSVHSSRRRVCCGSMGKEVVYSVLFCYELDWHGYWCGIWCWQFERLRDVHHFSDHCKHLFLVLRGVLQINGLISSCRALDRLWYRFCKLYFVLAFIAFMDGRCSSCTWFHEGSHDFPCYPSRAASSETQDMDGWVLRCIIRKWFFSSYTRISVNLGLYRSWVTSSPVGKYFFVC